MSAPSFMTRAERVERLLGDAHKGMGSSALVEDHPFDKIQTAEGFVGFGVSYLNCPDDEQTDDTKDNVALGIEIATKLKVGRTVYSVTATDADARDFHFFFIAASEDELFERVRAVLEAR